MKKVKDGLHNLCEPRLRKLGPIHGRGAKDWPDAKRRNTRSNVNEGPNPRKPMGLRAFLALGVVAPLAQATPAWAADRA